MTTDEVHAAVRQLLVLLAPPGPAVGKDVEREWAAAWQAADAVRHFVAAAGATDDGARAEALTRAARAAGWAADLAGDRLTELATRAELDAVDVPAAGAFEGRL